MGCTASRATDRRTCSCPRASGRGSAPRSRRTAARSRSCATTSCACSTSRPRASSASRSRPSSPSRPSPCSTPARSSSAPSMDRGCAACRSMGRVKTCAPAAGTTTSRAPRVSRRPTTVAGASSEPAVSARSAAARRSRSRSRAAPSRASRSARRGLTDDTEALRAALPEANVGTTRSESEVAPLGATLAWNGWRLGLARATCRQSPPRLGWTNERGPGTPLRRCPRARTRRARRRARWSVPRWDPAPRPGRSRGPSRRRARIRRWRRRAGGGCWM
jgi:hypothetical protein